ncbi:glutathione-disulfide reductase [Undibacterium sp. RTI2.1]|uniref:glutathione-disulfide reductase n=1 Tax=unclassified Undibacterium TaxID=2630295 RepID=UPI002AB3409E|nr:MULTISPECIES: glutathione-disulfide reductase [unclassified Undibacterium]MDY7537389.1 glutathione-disulfide reductase [Undibacterium sp. 5I1]MEB0031224.1 glutathione-disulfide reductase [Undibacterium sp. RTI2.1]MEB0117604.1 glutathione-disulfide reductase [Undibacterium sp. RTI2.2]MEB0232012.1 glutathione-disulfide reductase [Undibacterium sp. 10I3]MEB0259319.1 glutathione-disulfide reductase [Undibacterium sp. 5I1]
MSNVDFDFDFFVIGGGSGGVRAARVAASHGVKVAIAESDRYGGTCVIRGCIPKKLLVYASHFADDFSDAEGYGWTISKPTFSWKKLITAKDKEIDRLSRIYQDLLNNSGVSVLNGRAHFVDDHTVEVNGQRIRAKYILIATGGRPYRPSIPGIEYAITSDEAFELAELPKKVLIVGGGYIAVEFAGIFNALGAEVILSYRGEQVLRGFDPDLGLHLQEEMRKKGITIVLNSTVSELIKQDDGLIKVNMDKGDHGHLLFDTVMYATGRIPQIDNLHLEKIGVDIKSGGVRVDHTSRTSVPHIFAVGDVTNGIALTPVAIREGAALANSLFGPTPSLPDFSIVPSAVFSQPPIGTVGLGETDALEQYGELDIYSSNFKPLKNTLSGNHERTLMKLIVDTRTQKILGAHMIGPDSPEIIQGLAVAIRMGATKADFDNTIGIHPTAAEEFMTMREKKTKLKHGS